MVVKALAAGAIGLALGVAASGSILADPAVRRRDDRRVARRRQGGLARSRPLHARRAGAQRRDSAGARRGPASSSRASTTPGARSIARCSLSRRNADAGGALLDAEPGRRDGYPVENAAGRYGFRSSEILRDGDGGFSIYVSARAHAGNWLPIGAPDPFALALRLYDTPLGATRRRHRKVAPCRRSTGKAAHDAFATPGRRGAVPRGRC